MLKILSDQNRLYESFFMAIMTLFCFGFSLFRCVYTESRVFLFLSWNLFLAFIPWALTSLVVLTPRLQKSRTMLVFLLASWLLFFPNAPYILTDLFHLKLESAMPMWFDLLLILSFAWTGLLFGFLSLWDLEKLLLRSFTKTYVVLISTTLLFLSSFGIYIGRFLRWNSWDIIAKPAALLLDVIDRIINPFSHPRTWGMTIFLGLFLSMMYLSFRLIRKRDY